MKFRIFIFFTALLSCLQSNGQNHSFSYAGPYCKTAPNPTPSTSSNFVNGGNYLVTPAGISINGNTGVVNLANSAPGTYTVTYTGAICNCFTNAPVSATISILPSPTVTIAGTGTVCNGNSVTYTASGAVSYIWTTGAMTNTMTDFPFTNPTSYTVVGTGANGCNGSAVTTATVLPNPTITIVANPSGCVGYNYQLNASSSPGANYTWMPVPNTTSLASSANVTLSANTVFTVIASLAGCTATANHAVLVSPIPTLAVSGTKTLCAGSRTTLFASGAVTYTWNTGATADSLQLTPIQTSNYTVVGTDFNGCMGTSTVQVSVFAKPSVNIVGTGTICEGKTLAVTATGAPSYTWSNGSNSQSTNYIFSEDTVVNVIGMNANGCADTATLSVRVFPTPSVTVTNAASCAGASVQLIATPVGTHTDGLQYLWSSGGATDATLTVFPLVTTSYTVRTILGVCFGTAVGVVSVTPNTFPVVGFGYAGPYCTGGAPPTPTVAKNFATGGTYYSPMGVNVDPASGLVDLSTLTSGMYTIQYSVEPKGCTLKGVGSTVIRVDKSVKISLPERLEVAKGQTVQLTNSGGVTNYSWSPSNGLNCDVCETPVLTADKTQVYCVSSTQACSEGSCVLIDVLCERNGDNSVPTAFSPNKDGLNDRYCLQGWAECNKKFDIKIFDRWGNMVFESTDPNFCWDGYYNGDLLPAGVYVFSIRAVFSTYELVEKSGNITIIR